MTYHNDDKLQWRPSAMTTNNNNDQSPQQWLVTTMTYHNDDQPQWRSTATTTTNYNDIPPSQRSPPMYILYCTVFMNLSWLWDILLPFTRPSLQLSYFIFDGEKGNKWAGCTFKVKKPSYIFFTKNRRSKQNKNPEVIFKKYILLIQYIFKVSPIFFLSKLF